MEETQECAYNVKDSDNSSKIDLKRDFEEETGSFPNKKFAKEKEIAVSNEDIKSEVLNPVISPKENNASSSSWHDISSHITEGNCAVNSAVSGNSSPLDTLSEHSSENNSSPNGNNGSCDDSVSTSHVVLEIPEQVSTTGIRKITFKFSKRKEDVSTSHASVSNKEHHSVWADSGEDRHFCAPNRELRMSKKVFPNNSLTNVKKLLSTGILDGARVKYISHVRELWGIIDGGGYMCGCSSCNFSIVLSAYEFELHAGGKTRHPNNHIYLENGNPISAIIQELKTTPYRPLDEVIREVAGSSINEEYFQAWKASLYRNNGIAGIDENYSSMLPYSPHSLGRPSLLAYQKKTNEGGTRRRDNDLHRLLFMPNGLPDGAELVYSIKGQKMLTGYKHGSGIVCGCCDREISPSQFEAHAGMAARRQPYRHIYTSNGLTLHDIAMTLANGQNLTTGISDDMCTECGDGGDLIFCENCPRSFHLVCLDLQCDPGNGWRCPNCVKFGHGGNFARSLAVQLTRVVKTPEYEYGGCVVCRAQDFSTDTFDDRTVILCDQCEREFHVGCLRETGLCDLKELPKDNWFCCNECNRIHEALQNSVSSGLQMVPSMQLNIISRKHAEKGLFIDGAANDFQWRMLMGKSRCQEDLSLLSSAAAIFRECFSPIVAKSGRDLIPVMVYGRNISGQEFGGMYCVLLLVKNVVVSAGLLRIFGRDVAELPMVATRKEHQGKGYFQALFSCIERLLCSLNVLNLVLPAAEEAESIWTRRFGFRKMTQEKLSRYTRELQLTIFKGTSMLEKEVPQMI